MGKGVPFELSQIWSVLPGKQEPRVNTRPEPNLFSLSCMAGRRWKRSRLSHVSHTIIVFITAYSSPFTLLPATHYLITSSVLWALRLVLVSLHIGLRARWIVSPSSASFSSLAANLCAPANHHRISRLLHHRIVLAERHLELRAHVKPKSHSSSISLLTPTRLLPSYHHLTPLPPLSTPLR